MPSAARPSRPPLGLAIVLFLVAVDVGAAMQLSELGEAFARATRHGVDLWVAVGLGGQVLRIVGPLLGTILVLRRSLRSRGFWMALLTSFAVLAGLHLLVQRPPQAGAAGFVPSAPIAAFDLGAAESLRLLVVSLGWLAFWGTARGARRPFERQAERPAMASGFGGVAVPRRRAVSPGLVLALVSGGAVAVLLLQAALSEDSDLLARLVSSGGRKKPARERPAPELRRDEPVARIELPGPMRQILPGGRGRFLVVRLRQRSELVVFDSESRSLTSIELPDSDAPVAVGGERLMVFERDPPVAHVRSLAGLQRVQAVPLGPGGPVHLAALGSHDDRRLFLLRRGDDPRLEIRDASDPARVLVPGVETALAGPTPLAGYMVSSPHGDRLELGRGFCRRTEVCSESLTLAEDGTVTRRPWVVSSDVSTAGVPRLGFGPRDSKETIPSTDAAYHLVRPPPRSRTLTVIQGAGTQAGAVAQLEVPELAGLEINTLPEHLWLLPRAGLLVVVPSEGDRLVLYALDAIVPR